MKRKSLLLGGVVTVAAATLAVAHAQQGNLRVAPAADTTQTFKIETPASAGQLRQALSVQAAVQVPTPPIVLPTAAPSIALPVVAIPTVVAVETSTETIEAPRAPEPPAITLVAKIDLGKQRLTVVENGKTRFTWVISSGAKGFETPRGLFQPSWMAKDWYSRKYDNAPMPHSVFFKDGAAVHATMNTGTLGIPASHGCVRLSKPNAAQFFAMVQRHGMKHTRIHVFGVPRHDPDLVAARARPAGSTARVAMATSPWQSSYAAPVVRYSGYGSAVARPAYAVAPQTYRPIPMRVVQQTSRRY